MSAMNEVGGVTDTSVRELREAFIAGARWHEHGTIMENGPAKEIRDAFTKGARWHRNGNDMHRLGAAAATFYPGPPSEPKAVCAEPGCGWRAYPEDGEDIAGRSSAHACSLKHRVILMPS